MKTIVTICFITIMPPLSAPTCCWNVWCSMPWRCGTSRVTSAEPVSDMLAAIGVEGKEVVRLAADDVLWR